MPRRTTTVIALLTVLCAATAASAAVLGDIVAKMPARDTAEGLSLAAEIIKLGPAGLKELYGMITPPDRTGDVKARFALHGMALYVKRPGTETERAMVEQALLDALAAADNVQVKAFFIRQIQLAGSDAAAGPLGRLLADQRLCEPATQALLRIGTAGSVAQLRRALPTAKGRNLVTVVRALGEARDKASVEAILPHAAVKDRALRHTAWFALASIGDASAKGALAFAAESKGYYERSLGTKYYLLLARRLGEAGSADACAKICRGLLAARTRPADGNVRCAALGMLADVLGPKALNDVFAALSGPNVYVRDAAATILGRMKAPGATAQLVGRLKRASPQVKAAIIGVLGRSGDKDALPVLLAAASDKHKGIRLAAIDALVRLAPERAADVATAAMRATDAAEIAAARAVLMRLKVDGLSSAAAGGLAKASPAGKVALLEVLAARGATDQKNAIFPLLDDKDGRVRLAAARALGVLAGPADISQIIRQMLAAKDPREQSTLRSAAVTLCRRTGAGPKPILEALSQAKGTRRAALLPALAGVGGRDALAVVLDDVRGSDKAVQDAAVRALADWPDPDAIQPLLALAQTTKNRVQRTLAIRGYVRLVSLPSNRMPAHTARMLGEALAVAPNPADRKLVLAALSKIRAVEAMTLAVQCLDDSALREEAAMAAVKVACPTRPGEKGLRGLAVRKALEKIVKVSRNKWTLGVARGYLRSMPQVDAANLAQGRNVTATGTQEENYRPENAVDGNVNQESAWHAHPSPCSLIVDLEQPAMIDTVRVIFYWGDARYYRYDVQVSLDGRKWTKVVDNSRNTKLSTPTGQVHRFDTVEARYVGLNVIKNSANYAIHVVEFEVYAAGKAPKSFKTAPARQPSLPPLGKPDKDGFISLFNGEDLSGWVGATGGYGVEDGVLYCKPRGGGNLFTAHQFGDFILKFEFKLPPGANNGLGIRTPLKGNAAYAGMELQILDNKAKQYARLRPVQYHGSIYDVVAAKRGHLKPTGQWNTQEVRALGPKIAVILNGTTIVDADLDEVRRTADPKLLARHPGLNRHKGHIGWLGHGSKVEFRNIRIKPFPPYTAGPHNTPPKGFVALFNGKDLTGWKGLVGTPKTRAAMSVDKLAAEQTKADERTRKHWQAKDGVLVFDGRGKALCTAKDYSDFEMYVDWRIHAGGDSGIYLRGSPQVQIWDTAQWPEGSGGLYNNRKHPRKPLVCADNPVGQWNRFRIRMIGERVWVWLNGEKVVDNTVMENHCERSKPIYPAGQIELQHHGSTLWFRNIYIREIPRKE